MYFGRPAHDAICEFQKAKTEEEKHEIYITRIKQPFNKLVENEIYGSACIAAKEKEKKSNFAEQLKLLQKNADKASQTSVQNGENGQKKEFGDIFGDPDLFKNFGGFDTKKKEDP